VCLHSGATPYERAEKRAANFDTFTGNVATVNVNILQACSAGPSVANYETIMHNIEVFYAQATIRYARLLDIDYAEDLSTVDHRAEGQAFYRIIAPMVAAADPACNDVIDQLYNFDQTPVPGVQYYCEAVTCIPAALGVTATELGTLEDTDGICEGTTREFLNYDYPMMWMKIIKQKTAQGFFICEIESQHLCDTVLRSAADLSRPPPYC
jgi:hypothetical protein